MKALPLSENGVEPATRTRQASPTERLALPHGTAVTAFEGLIFVVGGSEAVPCATCSRSRLGPPLVRSGGRRVDVFVTSWSVATPSTGDGLASPICWSCVRDKTRGASEASLEWRSAVAGFLNELHDADPTTFRCEISSLA